LLQAIGLAGGFTRGAKQTKITVTRIEQGEKIIHRVDAAAFAREKKSQPFIVHPDDHILVPEKFW
jgi:protein involved in polysaccharide export with SLBB domain